MITLAVTDPGIELTATGATVHRVSGDVVDQFKSLKIAKYPEEPGLYLLYLDPSGNEVTDTFHDDLEGALAQARFEFGIGRDAWLFTS